MGQMRSKQTEGELLLLPSLTAWIFVIQPWIFLIRHFRQNFS